jgi:hypothetical protein
MKNPFDVLSMKERHVLRVKREVEALRIAASLLSDDPPIKETQRQEPPALDFNALQSLLDSIEETY